MKFLVTATPRPMPPPPELVREAKEWLQAKLDDGSFECVYAFPEGGGCSIGENASHDELMDDLMAYPLSPFVDYEVRPLVELDAAFERFVPFAEQISERMAAAAR